MMAMGVAYAQTPDCDGLSGDAFGLCNAYCYAMDCEGDRNASGQACVQVALSFVRATGDQPPCKTSDADPNETPTGSSCPCNFDQSWTKQTQILSSSDILICNGTDEDDPICNEDPDPYITCAVNDMSGSNTFLSVLANLWTGGTSSQDQQDQLLFFTSEPSTLPGVCGVDVRFSSGDTFITPNDGLPVTSDEFSACALDIGELQSAYADMCPNTNSF
jgi:hypothetical protein